MKCEETERESLFLTCNRKCEWNATGKEKSEETTKRQQGDTVKKQDSKRQEKA